MSDITLTTERLLLATPRAEQAPAMLDFVRRNHDRLKPWNPPAPADMFELSHWQSTVEKSAAAFAAGQAVRFWVSPRAAPEHIIASIGFSQISRGPFCACVLGYQIDAAYEGQGMMSESLRAAIDYMWHELRLHRISANYRPENVRSGRLLARLGFRIEGFARDYLFIDGAWRDHVLTSLTNGGFEKGWMSGTGVPTSAT